MEQKTLLIGAVILLVGMLCGLFISQFGMFSWSPFPMHDDVMPMYVGSDDYQDAPARRTTHGMMDDAFLMTSERTFIEHMVPHHEEAIATAQEVLDRGGTTPGMVALAENIISTQTEEVALMKQSYEEWFGAPYQPTGEYEPMMRELAGYSGVTLDRVFLHDMTMHHMGAIMMSRNVQPYLEHDVMRELTSNIIVNQTREIETMQALFASLQAAAQNE